MRADKIQTGLRIPQKKYEELTELAAQMGVSVNSLILMLIDLGLTLRNGRVTLLPEPQQGHVQPRICSDIPEERTQ